jgi:putative transposase
MAATTAVQVLADPYPEVDLPECGRIYILRALEAGPVRNVSDGVSNVTGFLSLPSLGESVPFESRTIEAICLTHLAIDEDVIAIVAQPTPIKLEWTTRDGKKRSSWHTPDYLVIYRDRVVLIECKPEDKLAAECSKAPDRFKKSANGEWISPAGIRATEELGICYEVFCPDQADQILTRNIDYLWDYLWKPLDESMRSAIQRVVDILARVKHINLKTLVEEVDDVDAINLAIAKKAVGFSWRTDLLRSPETATVYADNLHRDALSKAPVHALTPSLAPAQITVGTHATWINEQWSVLSIRNDKVTLVNTDHRIATLSMNEVRHLITTNQMEVASTERSENDEEAQSILQSTSPAALEKALARFEQLQQWLRGDLTSLSDRTARNWKKKADDASVRYGLPVLGLIDRDTDKGNRISYVDPRSRTLALESIEADYTNEVARSGVTAYQLYTGRCKKEAVPAVSYATYMNYLNDLNKDRQNAKRHGKRYAYQRQGPLTTGINSMPPNGDRAWEVAHIDHTPVDLSLASKITGENLGQPWMTIMIDGWSRLILAMFLTFYAPSRVSLMMVIRHCVKRWGRLPNKLVVDRGPEFQSTYFDKLVAGFNVSKLLRPTAEPRFGSVGERIFGTANTSLIHQLTGNTKNRVQRRGLSSTHDPDKFAIWTPDSFAELLDEWAFDVYPTTPHRGIADTPKERFERSVRETGARDLTRIPYNGAFLFATLPETPNGNTRKVHRGTVSIANLEYRGLVESINSFNGETGYTRACPDDPSKAWIFLENQWRELVCTNDLMREYMERAVTHSHLELSARLSKAGKKLKDVDAALLNLLEGVQDKEAVLRQHKATLLDTPTAEAPQPDNTTTLDESDPRPTTPMQVQSILELEAS